MGDIGAFPTIRHVMDSGITILNLTAGAAIKAGQAVEAAAAGVSGEVIPGVGTTAPVGVAQYGAASGEPVAVASVGCVVTVANASDSVVIDAGDWVTVDANAVGGTVSPTAVTKDVIGIAIDDIAVSSTGRILIAPSPYIAAA